jgi:hypothetical protein
MVIYKICVFGADRKSNMAARAHNVFSLAEILKIFLSETTKSIDGLWPGELKIGQSETRIAYGGPCLVMDHNKMCSL